MSVPFRLALKAREKLYTSGLFRTRRLDHPVVSVGNLTLGGTGKTPLTIFLAAELSRCGFRPVILSRGYRRRSHGAVIVSSGGGPLVSWEESGDEPFLMAQRLNGTAAVVVGESRYLAGQAAQQKQLGNLFILDDAFQHRQLHRDVDIVTIDPREWSEGESLLPWGRWREPQSAVNRASAACVMGSTKLPLAVPQFRFELKAEGIFQAGKPVTPESIRGRKITAFAGIAKPDRFFTTLEALGIHPDSRVSFPDHHRFSEKDLAGLQGEVLITTEKDAVRLPHSERFFTLRVSATIAESDRLRDLILRRLENPQCK